MRKISLFLLLVLCTGMLHAQNKRSYTSGFKAGLNLSNLRMLNDFEGTSDMRTNFHAGIFYSVPFGSKFSLQPEVMFSGEGASFKTNTAETDTKLGYISIPVMFQFNTTSGLYIETGPALGVMVKGKETVKTSAATSELDLKKQIKKTNLQWAGGVGYRLKNLGFNARYYFGLSNMAKVESRADTKSSLIQVSVSWMFKQ
jgi:hypothetical protein